MQAKSRIVASFLLVAGWAYGQSLGDIARAEREKRAQQGGASTKVFTNDDFGGPSGPNATGSSSPECNEASALEIVRTINQAETSYIVQFPRGYSKSLSELGPPTGTAPANADHAQLIPTEMAKGATFELAGYRFTYATGPPDSRGVIGTYTLHARPLQYGQTGKQSIFAESSVSGIAKLHATSQERAGTSIDSEPAALKPCPKPPVNRYAGMSRKELERAATEIKLSISQLEQSPEVMRRYVGQFGFTADGKPGDPLTSYRNELQKLGQVAPDLARESGGSIEDNKRAYYSKLDDKDRRELIAVYEKAIAGADENRRNLCGRSKDASLNQACEQDYRKMIDGFRAEIALLRR